MDMEKAKNRADVLRLLFESIDDDQSGEIELLEFYEHFEAICPVGVGCSFQEFFDAYDTNGDEAISEDEFVNFLLKKNEKRDEKRFREKMAGHIVICRSVKASSLDTRAIERELRRLKTKEDIVSKAFDAIDDDRSGFIDKYELAEHLQRGYKIENFKIDEYFKKFDMDGDHKISRQEFVSRMLKSAAKGETVKSLAKKMAHRISEFRRIHAIRHPQDIDRLNESHRKAAVEFKRATSKDQADQEAASTVSDPSIPVIPEDHFVEPKYREAEASEGSATKPMATTANMESAAMDDHKTSVQEQRQPGLCHMNSSDWLYETDDTRQDMTPIGSPEVVCSPVGMRTGLGTPGASIRGHKKKKRKKKKGRTLSRVGEREEKRDRRSACYACDTDQDGNPSYCVIV